MNNVIFQLNRTIFQPKVIQLSLAEFPLSRQTNRQANQCTFKRSLRMAIFTETTFQSTLVCLSACLPAKWEFCQTQ